MQEKHITVSKTARYFTLGQLSPSLEQVWYIFHGYGQLASDILKDFSSITKDSCYFIAPEGFSRFYLSGTSGDVGASWMTKEDRNNEIADYLQYLEIVNEQVTQKLPKHEFKTILFGFSQGVSTVCRWLGQLKIEADLLVLWAGIIPPDVDLWKIKAHYPSLQVYIVAGTQDPYARSDVIKEQEERLEKAEMHYRKIRFDGKHELHTTTLSKFIDY